MVHAQPNGKGVAAMANQYDYDDDDDFETEEAQGPANLRKALKKAEREAKAMREELEALRSQQRQQSVKSVLEQKGVNPKIAALLPKDVDSPEKIDAWLSEYSDVFSALNTQSDDIEDPNREINQRIDRTISTASTPAREEDMMSRLTSVKNKEELDQLIFGSSLGR